MNILSIVMAAFAMLGALDRIIGNRFGIGKEFEKGFRLFGPLALSMIGMIIISPLIAELLSPFFGFLSDTLHIDPSIVTASLFANDMGGASLSTQVAAEENIGLFNGLVVSSMMGCTVSFTIPNALGMVDKERHKPLLMGLLCGVITIPVGSFFAGLICGIDILPLLFNLLPLVIFSALIALGLMFFPHGCVKIFAVFGRFIQALITVGLALGILKFLTGFEPVSGLDTIENGADICLGICVFMTGALPLLYILSRLFAHPLRFLGSKLGISESSAMGFVSTLATSVTTFEMMNRMDRKGIMLNSAFAVSAAFTLADHMAFTLTFNSEYIPSMVVGKLTSGILALLLAAVVYKRSGISEE